MKEVKRREIVFAVISVVLIIVLGLLLIWQGKNSSSQAKELESIADTLSDEAAETTAEAETETEAQTEETQTEETQAAETGEVSFSAVSCRGDGFISYGVSGDSYAVYLEDILADAGSSVTVADYTLDMVGSLTQLLLAGISTDVVDAYIDAHQEAADAAGTTLADTETDTRNLTDDQYERDDEDMLPVISIGNRGGWGDDLDELIEQQTLILSTYSQQEYFLILGSNGSDTISDDDFDAAMEAAWGDNYLSVTDLGLSSVTSEEARETIAQAVYEKLTELGYIG